MQRAKKYNHEKTAVDLKKKKCFKKTGKKIISKIGTNNNTNIFVSHVSRPMPEISPEIPAEDIKPLSEKAKGRGTVKFR